MEYFNHKYFSKLLHTQSPFTARLSARSFGLGLKPACSSLGTPFHHKSCTSFTFLATIPNFTHQTFHLASIIQVKNQFSYAVCPAIQKTLPIPQKSVKIPSMVLTSKSEQSKVIQHDSRIIRQKYTCENFKKHSLCLQAGLCLFLF